MDRDDQKSDCSSQSNNSGYLSNPQTVFRHPAGEFVEELAETQGEALSPEDDEVSSEEENNLNLIDEVTCYYSFHLCNLLLLFLELGYRGSCGSACWLR